MSSTCFAPRILRGFLGIQYVVADVAPKFTRYPLFDAFHETFPEVVQIAPSFEDFLARALNSGGRSFWLEE